MITITKALQAGCYSLTYTSIKTNLNRQTWYYEQCCSTMRFVNVVLLACSCSSCCAISKNDKLGGGCVVLDLRIIFRQHNTSSKRQPISQVSLPSLSILKFTRLLNRFYFFFLLIYLFTILNITLHSITLKLDADDMQVNVSIKTRSSNQTWKKNV